MASCLKLSEVASLYLTSIYQLATYPVCTPPLHLWLIDHTRLSGVTADSAWISISVSLLKAFCVTTVRSQVYIFQHGFPFKSSLPVKYERSGKPSRCHCRTENYVSKLDLKESLLVQHRAWGTDVWWQDSSVNASLLHITCEKKAWARQTLTIIYLAVDNYRIGEWGAN